MEKRMAYLENRIDEMGAELEALRKKHTFTINNSFGSATNNYVVTCENFTNTTTNNNTAPDAAELSPAAAELSPAATTPMEDMHPFGEEVTPESEFLSVAQFKECGYNPVKLLQLSHFNPAHPQYMNIIMDPSCYQQTYVYGRDRCWAKTDLQDSLMPVLRSIVQRMSRVNPAEASKYKDDAAFLQGGAGSVTFRAMQGMAMHSRTCIRVLSERGVPLPEELRTTTENNNDFTKT